MPFVEKNLPCIRVNHNCSRCNRTFSDKESLIQHLQHSSKHRVSYVPESCVHCGRSFSCAKALIQHLQSNRHHVKDLHYAACTGKFQLVDQLMRNEYADAPGDSHLPCSKSQTGFTPMHCAAFGGHYECLKVMLSWSDGKPNVIDPKDGRTPVHLAAWKGHGSCLKLLLMKGGNLHSPDRKGDTPISLTCDHYCLSIILFHLADKQTRLQARGYQTSERDIKSLELVWNRLYGEKSFEQQFRVIVETFHVEEISEGSPVVCQVQQIQSNNEIQELFTEPYEVLARGEMAVKIFNQALREGKAQVTRLQLTVIGDIGAGKTCLVRNLSGEEFVEERTETHGINTSMVEMTELDELWHVADLNKSHVDDILTDKVCEGIKNSTEASGRPRELQLSSSDPGPSLLGERCHSSGIRRLPSIECAPLSAEGNVSDETSMTPVSSNRWFSRSRSEQTPPRDMPVDLITRKLSEASFEEKGRKYTKISIWDFAGHPLYEAMHHVFLNRRSFYLVVTNLSQLCDPESRDQALKELHFWLNSVRVHTPQTSPIFLVGTCRDKVSQQDISDAEKVLYAEFVETFGEQLVRSKEKSFLFAVENSLGSEDDGALLLKETIEEEASRLMLMEELPVLWLHFEEEILKCREEPDCPACVPKSFLKKMIESNFRVVDETFESMLRFYHDSGVIILPEELIGPETQNPEINDLVVINPQYLVDVMTCLHDIPDRLDVDREHRTQWKTLQDRGITDISLLKHVWKDFESPVTELVGIMEASGMLCPITTLAQVEDLEDRSEQDGNEDLAPGISKYIVPFHLKEKCLKGRWQKLCLRTWDGICTSDKVLMFDFHSFLPPAVFHYFIVRTGAKSKTSSGMRPIIAKDMAIFSFGDSYFILAEACQKYNQIKISARYKNSKKPHELFNILMSIMKDICQRQFRFLKFRFGPVCPNPRCPGASCDGKVRSSDSSSDESDGEKDGNSTCDEADDGRPRDDVRPHVICIDPEVSSRPLWCNSTPVHEFEEIKIWLAKPQDAVSKVPEDSPCYSMKVQVCCMALVAKAMANKWRWLGRTLGVEDTVINNIQTENEAQEERSYQVLQSWVGTKGSKATVHSLMKAIQEVGIVEAMEAFDRHLGELHGEETST